MHQPIVTILCQILTNFHNYLLLESLLNLQQNDIILPTTPKICAALPRETVALELRHCTRHRSICSLNLNMVFSDKGKIFI